MKALLPVLVLALGGCAGHPTKVSPPAVPGTPSLALSLPPVDTQISGVRVARGVRALSQLEVGLVAAYLDHKWPRSSQRDHPRYFLSLAGDLDPDTASLERLAALGFSIAQGSMYREARGVVVSVSNATVAKDLATIDAGWHGGPFAGEMGRYHLRLRAGQWVVERTEYEVVE